MSTSTCPQCRRNFDPAAAYCPFCGVKTEEAPVVAESAAEETTPVVPESVAESAACVTTEIPASPSPEAAAPAAQEPTVQPPLTEAGVPAAEAPVYASAPASAVTLQPDMAIPPYGAPIDVAPPPRKKRWPVITAIVAAAVLILCGGAFVTYRLFTRDILLLFMGEEKYAARLEEQLTEKITGSAAEQLTQMSILLMQPDQASTITSQLKLTLDADFASDMELDMAEIQPILDYISTLKCSTRLNEKGDATTAKIALSDAQGALLNTEFWMKDGQYLLREPLISDQLVVIGKPTDTALVSVTFEKEKLQASLDKLLDIYRKALADGTVTLTKEASVSIDDLDVTKVQDLTVSLSTQQFRTMLTDMLTALRDDAYVADTLVAMWSNYMQKAANFQDIGLPNFTVEKYKEALDEAIKAIEEATEFPSLTVHSFLRANNQLAARQYVLKNTENLDFTVIFPENKTASSALEVRFKDGVARLINTPDTEKSGELLFFLKDTSDDKEEIGELKLTYAELGTASLLGQPVTTGDFSLAITRLPDSVLEELKDTSSEFSITQEHFTKSKFQWSLHVEDKTATTSVNLALHSVGTLAINQTITEEAAQEVTLPAYSKEKDIVLENLENPDETASTALTTYMLKALDYAKKVLTEHTDLAKLLEPLEITPAIVDTTKGQLEFQTGVGFPMNSTFTEPEAAGRAFVEAQIAGDMRTQLTLLLPELQKQFLAELQQQYESYDQFTEQQKAFIEETYGAGADIRVNAGQAQAHTKADIDEFIQSCGLECASQLTDMRYIEMTLVVNGETTEPFFVNVLLLDGVWYIW